VTLVFVLRSAWNDEIPGAVIYVCGTLKKFPVFVGMIVENVDKSRLIVLNRSRDLLASLYGRLVENVLNTSVT